MLIHNLTNIASTDGVRFAAVRSNTSELEVSSDDARRSGMIESAIRIMELSGKPIRVHVADETVLVERYGDEVVGVVVAIGHPTMKSINRMLRRMAAMPGARAARHGRRVELPPAVAPKRVEVDAATDDVVAPNLSRMI